MAVPKNAEALQEPVSPSITQENEQQMLQLDRQMQDIQIIFGANAEDDELVKKMKKK